METNFTDVKDLYEALSIEDANRYLAAGWKLLSTHIRDNGYPGCRSENTTYVLAWFAEQGQEPVRPRNKYADVKIKRLSELEKVPRTF